ncbi:MAG TPA: hypothetical protein VGR47_11620 [Terracidiphilus sp.]|nr:hypothetical protein [Terracidiphilus sp.]
MSVATYPEPQIPHQQTEKVIVIAGGSPNIKLPEDLREEIRRSGWDCEIVQGDISDCTHIRKLVHDVLVNYGVISGVRCIPKMTEEEWLAH